MLQFAGVVSHPDLPPYFLVTFESEVGLADGFQHFPGSFAVFVKIHCFASLDSDRFAIVRMKQRKKRGRTDYPVAKSVRPLFYSGMSLSWLRRSYAHQYGIQQIQRDTEADFPNERSADSAFGGRVRSRIELFEFVRAGLGATH
jgi:hypothetical protein